MPDPAVLDGPQELTAEWVTQALREADALSDGGAVSAISWEPIGDGYYGVVVRIHLDWGAVAAGAPSTVIGKFSSSTALTRERADVLRFYANEVGFYRDITGTDGRGAGMPVPACFHAAYDRESAGSTLLLEDVDGEVGDHVEGCTPEQVEQVVRCYAACHARWWEAPDLDEYGWLAIDPARAAQDRQTAYDRSLERALELSEPLAGPQFSATMRRTQPHVASLTMAVRESPRTFCHGDAHAANVFFPRAGALSPERLVICDWQLAVAGLGTSDIARFPMVSMAPDQRRAAAPGLAEVYLSELKAGGIESYSTETYDRDFRVCTLFHLSSFMIAFGTVDTSSESGRALLSSIVPRLAAALEDLGDVADILDGLDSPSDGP